MILSLAAVGAGAEGPTAITSFDQITDMAGNYVLSADIVSAGAPSIGTKEAPFTGVFDGAGHTVSGLTGMVFAYTSGATVKNVIVTNSVVEFKGVEDHTGLICGNAEGGTFTEIHLGPGVHIEFSEIITSDLYLGGIIGNIYGQEFTVSYCSNEGTVTHTSLAKSRMGGIIGMAYGQSVETCVISNCWNTGNVINDSIPGKNDTKVAGIVANGEVIHITQCYNLGNVSSNETNGQSAGIFGCPSDYGGPAYKVSFCYNGGEITNGKYAGGILAYTNRADGDISFCANFGTVTGGEDKWTGGIIGFAKKTEKVSNLVSLKTACNKACGVDTGKDTNYDYATIKEVETQSELIAAAQALSIDFAEKDEHVALAWQLSYTYPDTGKDEPPVTVPVETTPEETAPEATDAEQTTAEQTTAEQTTAEAPVATAGESDVTDKSEPETTTAAAPEKKGCGSFAACGAVIVALLGSAVIIGKRK